MIARPVSDRGLLRWQYWCGNQDSEKHSLYRCDAYHFASASEALQCADTHEELQNSDEWRAIRADTATTIAHGRALLERATRRVPPRETD